jgi:nucleotide-binding universal stress UspA family protein
MITKILVPIDGSETARKALEYAADLAKQTGSTLILLSVVEPPSPLYIALLENLEGHLMQIAETHIADAEGLCRAKGVESQKLIRTGYPVEEIIKAAEDSQADLIIMGSHGKSALGSALLGSVTMGVIYRKIKFPILVVRQ